MLALRVTGIAFVLALLALVIAVYVTRGQLPSFDELKSSPNGQTIRVHALDVVWRLVVLIRSERWQHRCDEFGERSVRGVRH